MKKQLMSILFSVILIFIIKNVCYAASANISCEANATVGKETTITANVTGVMWNLELKVNGETIAKNSELENYESNKTVTFSGKYTPKSEGNLTVTLEGTVTEFSDGSTIRKFNSKTINVKAPIVETTKEPETSSSNNKPTQTEKQPEKTENSTVETTKKSSEARLKNLGIKPNDFSGFKKDKMEYSIDVPNDVDEVEIYAEKLDDKATIKGTGKVVLNEGNNTFEIKVTAEDGKTTKVYKLTIKRRTAVEEEKVQSEARLATLGIKPKEYDFSGFNSEKTEYNVEIPSDIEEIEVYATAVNSKSQITGIGMIELEEGNQTLSIEVISENGTKKVYKINVIRIVNESDKNETSEDEIKNGLKSLTVKGMKFSPQFNTGIYEYRINLTEDIQMLEIDTSLNDDSSTIEILGNENLQEGENIITILVTNNETEEIITYQIIVNKKIAVEDDIIKASWLKPSTWGKEEKIKLIIIIVLIILIISAIILKIKISRDGDSENDVNFPGANELDKAIAEHQELSEEGTISEKNSMENIVEPEFQEIPKRKGRHF